MVVNGVVGVLAHSLVHMELVCGKILDKGGLLYLCLSRMKLEMDQKCSSGYIRGVELLLQTAIMNYIGFVETKRQVWLI